MKKAIVLDLDGTLLNSTKNIETHSLMMIEKAVNMKWEIIISTSRPVRATKIVVPKWFNDFYWVVCNGAWIIKKNKILKRNEISNDSAIKLIEVLKKNNLSFFVEAEDLLFSEIDLPTGFYGKCNDLDKLGNKNICKILIKINSFKEQMKALGLIPKYFTSIITDKGGFIQILQKGCNKLNGVKYILDNEGISLNDTIAFGDDNNDFELIKTVGTGVAMGNATEMLKKVATNITFSNDNDGVGIFLKKLFSDSDH
jgi:Cof subfamily protein (haloacid dehalogenase superfamily)